MNDNILKILDDLFVIYYMLANLKMKLSRKYKIYIDEIIVDVLTSFNLIFNDYERSLKNGS